MRRLVARAADGLADRRITTRSEGASRPLCTDATDECHARNRRVEVTAAE